MVPTGGTAAAFTKHEWAHPVATKLSKDLIITKPMAFTCFRSTIIGLATGWTLATRRAKPRERQDEIDYQRLANFRH
jgi:hypothetical protein